MIYNDFRDCENATILIKTSTTGSIDEWGNIIPSDDIIVFSGKGIYYEVSASEKIARSQIQESATHTLILDPTKVTNQILSSMDLKITTEEFTDKEHRIVTVKNPLNKNEAIILTVKEN